MKRASALLLLGITFSINALAQTSTITVMGSCRDFHTSQGLKATLYALVGGRRQQLGVCQDEGPSSTRTGRFEVEMPILATHLLIESAGYRPQTIPVYASANVPSHSQFSIWNLGAMNPLDSLPVLTTAEDFLSLSFVCTDTTQQLQFSLANAKGIVKTSTVYVTDSRKAMHFPVAPGKYTITLTTLAGTLLTTDEVLVRPGVTFRAYQIGIPVASTAPAKPTFLQRTQPADDTVRQPIRPLVNVTAPVLPAPSATMVYFDQSSYHLRTQNLPTLDSIASVLITRPLQATVTGHTDDVGARDPNVTLSEYRARRVATYLTRRGVVASQLTTQWKGPDSTANLASTEATKAKSRRVEIRVGPK